MPELFTVQASGPAVKAVFRPTASFEARAVVRNAGTDRLSERPFVVRVPLMPIDPPAADVKPDPTAPNNDSVKPLLAEFVVPEMFVRFKVGLPWLWFESAAVVRKLAVDT